MPLKESRSHLLTIASEELSVMGETGESLVNEVRRQKDPGIVTTAHYKITE